jgi:hypothetical protein
VIEVPLTQGMKALIDDEDAALIQQYHWYAAKRKHTYYAGTNNNGEWPGQPTAILMHRLLTGFPVGVDHINGNGLDNRRKNLRPTGQSGNLANQRATRGTSKYKGVSWVSRLNKWRAYISPRSTGYRHLGTFASEAEAARAYDRAAIALWGAFARTNFPKEDYV